MAECKFYVQVGEVLKGPWSDQGEASNYLRALTQPGMLWVLWEGIEDEGETCGSIAERWNGGSAT